MSFHQDTPSSTTNPTTKIIRLLNDATHEHIWESLCRRVQLNFHDGQDQSLLYDELNELNKQVSIKQNELNELKQKQDIIKTQLISISEQNKAFLVPEDWDLICSHMKERRWKLLHLLQKDDPLFVLYKQDDFYISFIRHVFKVTREKESILRISYTSEDSDIVSEREIKFDALPQYWDVFPIDKELCDMYSLTSKKIFNQANIFDI